MIHHAYLDADEGGWTLVLEDENGSHIFPVDPEMVELALQPWRDYVLEGEIVRREWEAARRAEVPALGDRERFVCLDPEGEWAAMVAEQGDALRKRYREGASVDPADETDYKDAA